MSFKKLALVVGLFLLPSNIWADRQYPVCDPIKSKYCNGLVAVYEFEEASDFARTSETAGTLLLEPDGANIANSSTHKTGTYSLAHTAVANSYLYIARAAGMTGEYTASFWVYVDTLPSATTKRVQVLSIRDSLGNEGYPRIYLYNNAGTTNFKYEVKQGLTDTVTTVTSSQAISTATWYLVVFGQYPSPTSSEPIQQTIWVSVNAGAKNVATITYPDVSTLGDFIVGGWLNTSPTEYGAYKLDQLSAWDGSFSPADLTKFYAAGAGKAFPFVD